MSTPRRRVPVGCSSATPLWALPRRRTAESQQHGFYYSGDTRGLLLSCNHGDATRESCAEMVGRPGKEEAAAKVFRLSVRGRVVQKLCMVRGRVDGVCE